MWQDGLPYSTQYGDVYFSRDNGLAETRHVFLRHNLLAERWQSLQSGHFTIAETGFGTGLNFLCAWQLWRQIAPTGTRLHFISCEKHPLSRADLESALALWPELANQTEALLAQYQRISTGMHRLEFDQGHVVLTLIIGDATEALSDLHAGVDAWFLDGFAPSRNPDMWQPALFRQMARLSHRETTFATFTSAGLVRRGLQEAGFSVEKVAGHGRKREMLCGRFAVNRNIVRHPPDKALVIGAGIAGCATAHALARRGCQVTLVERHPHVAAEASGNPAGMLYPRLAMQDTVMSRLALTSFLHVLRLIERLHLAAGDFSLCGLLQLAYDRREAERCLAIARRDFPTDIVHWVDAATASIIAGVPLHHNALYFPQAGWVRPAVLCSALAGQAGIRLQTGSPVLRIVRHDGLWQAWDDDTLLDEALVMVLAAANDCLHFAPAAHLPLQPVRGQISVAAAFDLSRRLGTVLCTDGYISPNIDGWHCLGATFSPDDRSVEIRAQDHLDNLAMLGRMSRELRQGLDAGTLQGRAALRVATPDYLPLVGALMDASALLANPPKHYSRDPMPWLPGLYVHTGHGSKGITQAPLCAELLASAIHGEPLPLDSRTVSALDPNRFLLRKLGLKNRVRGLTGYPEAFETSTP